MSDPVCAKLLSLIGTADDVWTLRGLRDQIHEQMEALLSEQPVEQFYMDLNRVHDALIKRTIALSEEQMARMGNGSPPVPYAYLLFGSGGREEQTLSSDQDSGLIYGDSDDETKREEISQYFNVFSKTIVELLKQVGYPPCEGEVISTNKLWNQSLSEWKKQLNSWFEDPNWERVRYLLIVADCRLIYGKESLLLTLQDHFYSDMLKNPVIVKHMLNNTMRHKMLLGVFGQLLKEQYGEDAGSLDVKYGAYIPMVNAIRLLSIECGLRQTSTLGRIRGLVQQGKLSQANADIYSDVFRLFLKLRLMTTERNEEGFYSNSGKLASRRLTRDMIQELKSGLRIGKKLQRSVYKQTMGRL
ncbi:hypothetical protein Back11_06680 [Paenibacillus baekrokdamisoli]|uniref:Uncharacterized protein n=1 Tax=Paenibacillus baekrokdamisoli TaxID=1712516 RepID=A0A3G9J3N6_9BACL|nr:DUF294 nucleotidyltransferase-like domain-containing protein [Paenibacillus baekrokdamisoli]MBB3067492.1 CBS domain-containing protein [Paenibacillus baekrokdamisoli]BBH19323.1 hypothetical protein Back11_06680 [Paenibacillus baekrokdamisoli]